LIGPPLPLRRPSGIILDADGVETSYFSCHAPTSCWRIHFNYFLKFDTYFNVFSLAFLFSSVYKSCIYWVNMESTAYLPPSRDVGGAARIQDVLSRRPSEQPKKTLTRKSASVQSRIPTPSTDGRGHEGGLEAVGSNDFLRTFWSRKKYDAAGTVGQQNRPSFHILILAPIN
jgi:hypothetical protein